MGRGYFVGPSPVRGRGASPGPRRRRSCRAAPLPPPAAASTPPPAARNPPTHTPARPPARRRRRTRSQGRRRWRQLRVTLVGEREGGQGEEEDGAALEECNEAMRLPPRSLCPSPPLTPSFPLSLSIPPSPSLSLPRSLTPLSLSLPQQRYQDRSLPARASESAGEGPDDISVCGSGGGGIRE